MLYFTGEISFRSPYFDPLMSFFRANSIFDDYIDLYLVALSIGAYLDKWVDEEKYDLKNVEHRSIPRIVLNNPDYKKNIEFIYENIVLKTRRLDISDDIRLLTAFDPKQELSEVKNIGKFLNGYMYYGLEILNRIDQRKIFILDTFADLFDIIDDVKNNVNLLDEEDDDIVDIMDIE